MDIKHNDEIQHLIDNPLNLRCPHCTTLAAMIPISVPRYALIHRYKLREVGICARCSSCNRAVFFTFDVKNIQSPNHPVLLDDSFTVSNLGLEPFELSYLSGAVLDDFQEALTCYATSSWNAFAAMCRRCIQSISEALGVEGSSKVQAQLQDLREMGVADEDTFDQLFQIMLAGHDGAHPHLPALSAARAGILMQLMKDVLYQLFVRPAKIREAGELRKNASAKKS